ncbi:hypothetical protein ACIRFF_27140 [Streptomyces cyaneofuscatus]
MSARRLLPLSSLLLVIGCQSAGESIEEEPPPPASRQAQGIVLPFDSYEFTLGEYYTVINAQDALTQACMRSRGFDWEVIDRPMDAREARNRRRYGVIEPAVAERYGYHAPSDLLNPYGISEQEESRRKQLSAKEAKAAEDATTGCDIKAYEKLVSDANADVDLKLFDELGKQAMADSRSAPKVASAIRKWSSCMKGKGFNYSGSSDAGNDKRWWEGDTENASEEEIETAKADVSCRQEAGVVGVWFEEEKRLQQKAIQENQKYFKELAAAKERHVAAAQSVLKLS